MRVAQICILAQQQQHACMHACGTNLHPWHNKTITAATTYMRGIIGVVTFVVVPHLQSCMYGPLTVQYSLITLSFGIELEMLLKCSCACIQPASRVYCVSFPSTKCSQWHAVFLPFLNSVRGMHEWCGIRSSLA